MDRLTEFGCQSLNLLRQMINFVHTVNRMSTIHTANQSTVCFFTRIWGCFVYFQIGYGPLRLNSFIWFVLFVCSCPNLTLRSKSNELCNSDLIWERVHHFYYHIYLFHSNFSVALLACSFFLYFFPFSFQCNAWTSESNVF